MQHGRPGIADIAERAGVSRTTVSHALNPNRRGRVAEQTRQLVENVAREMGYAPDPFARALRTQRSHTLAMISDEIATTPYAGRLILGAQEEASRLGFVLLLVTTGYDRAVETREIETLRRYHVDGVLYAATSHRVVRVPRALDGLPLCVVNAETPARSRPRRWCVFPDEAQGGRIATQELLQAGHTRIGMINATEPLPAADGRLAGYEAALSEAGIRPERGLVVAADTSDAEGGYAAARRLLARQRPPSALFCFNDRMAMGAYQAAAELGVRVPDDLSVVGFDNQEIVAGALAPKLTTVALPYYEMGASAVRALVGALADEAVQPARVAPARMALENQLVRRSSVAAPAKC